MAECMSEEHDTESGHTGPKAWSVHGSEGVGSHQGLQIGRGPQPSKWSVRCPQCGAWAAVGASWCQAGS